MHAFCAVVWKIFVTQSFFRCRAVFFHGVGAGRFVLGIEWVYVGRSAPRREYDEPIVGDENGWVEVPGTDSYILVP